MLWNLPGALEYVSAAAFKAGTLIWEVQISPPLCNSQASKAKIYGQIANYKAENKTKQVQL